MGRSGDPQSVFNPLDEPSAADRRFFPLPIKMTCHPERERGISLIYMQLQFLILSSKMPSGLIYRIVYKG
jgi:hypothetical protein